MYLRAVLFLLLLDFNNAGSYSSMLHECEYSSVSTPRLMGLEEEGLCDTNSTITCCLRPILHLSRKTGVTVTDHVRCRFRQISIKDGGYTVTGPVSEVPGTVVACDQVTCIVPDGQIPLLDGLIFPGWLISVTTDGTDYSNEKIYLPYDGRCLDCVWVGVAKNCTLREDYCYISGQCIPRGAQNPGEDCQICDPDKSLLQYSGGNACMFGGKCVPYGMQHPNDSCRVCDRDQKDFVMRTEVCVSGNGTCVNAGEQDPDTTCRTCEAGTFVFAPKDGTCYIGSTCFNDTTVNPQNNCERCNSAANQTAFSQRDDVCMAGDGTCVNAGEQDPNTTCRTCEAGTFVFAPKDDTCYIGSTCFNDTMVNPQNNCEQCNSGASQTTFSRRNDVCVTSGGACIDVGQGDPSTNCQICMDVTFQFEAQGGFCMLNGQCYPDGSDHPTDSCMACNGDSAMFVSKSGVCTTQNGTCVDAGQPDPDSSCRVCNNITLQFQVQAGFCLSGDTCVDDGLDDPADSCKVCNGGEGAFTPKTNMCVAPDGSCVSAGQSLPGSSCRVCNAGTLQFETQAGFCFSGETCAADGDEDPLTPCKLCDGSQDEFVLRQDRCLIGGNCYNETDRNPQNNCEECKLSSPTQWTQLTVAIISGTSTCTTECNYFRNNAPANFDLMCKYTLSNAAFGSICRLIDITDLTRLQCPNIDLERALAVCGHNNFASLHADPVACP